MRLDSLSQKSLCRISTPLRVSFHSPIEEAESALRTMAKDLHPTTKSGFVRVMLPAIEDALKAGHTRKASGSNSTSTTLLSATKSSVYT